MNGCCEQGQYCFNITQDYFPTEFTVFAMESSYVTNVIPQYTFFDAHFHVVASYVMFGSKYNCFSSSVDCQYNTWCTYSCGQFNISSYVANRTNTGFEHKRVSPPPSSVSTLSNAVTSGSSQKQVQRVNGIQYWGLWVDADLLYSAFTNSVASSLACGVPGCDTGDYCFNVTDGDGGVPTDFQVFAVFSNATVTYFDVYDFSVRLSASRYKLVVTLTSNFTTTACPLTASDGAAVSVCNYGDTCTATCPYNSVNIGFTLAQPMNKGEHDWELVDPHN